MIKNFLKKMNRKKIHPSIKLQKSINSLLDQYNKDHEDEIIFLIKGADRDENGHISIMPIKSHGKSIKDIYMCKGYSH